MLPFTNVLGHRDSNWFSYVAYGLGIRSVLPIPEFVPAEDKSDVTITIDQVGSVFDYVPQEVIEQPLALQVERKEAVVYVKEAGVFLVQGGCKIVVIPAPDVDELKLRLALVGTVMAILLQQRSPLVLHASAVEIDGKAVLFLGNSGEGKSTIAAALQAQGYAVVADDIAPVSWEEGKAMLAPGFPQIKISREVAEVLGYDWESLWQLHPKLEKRGLRLRRNFPQRSLPISRIYLLASGSEVKCEPMKKQAKLIALMQHSELMKLFSSGEVMQFESCASLAQSCEVICLRRPRNLSLLSELVKVVEEDVCSSLLLTNKGYLAC
ncbi:MAG: hypothetical protein F6K50_48010 [Moorea sp. SIO3I7]|uniref:hypothetical protein n=1 Tax=unclassified Moorena TaxID=2683338 RepID=UPI0013BAFC0D|nr:MULTISPECIES: hypothetical protein [unclassified Moorena]NEO02804.1 hypothetical protein [Moorena sp. SIO3I7]NEO61964.1 hypothetical protein [Moorena sp. SIO4G2]NEQ85631.1 hypothetical protein [Moorena sp. SIO2I5]NEO14260.1 hypothetical protein [Moorena sp. SIO3E8]NEO24285.1 hypothetical protein [Moorena sp. SIO4A5]